MKIFGVVLISIAVVIGIPAVKVLLNGGYGSSAGEITRLLVSLALPVFFLIAGIILISPTRKK